MVELLNDLQSIRWWLGVVAVGFVINLLAAYVKPWIDERISRYSSKKRSKLEKLREHRKIELLLLEQSPEDRYFKRLDAIDQKMSAIADLCLAVLLWVMSYSVSGNFIFLKPMFALLALVFIFSWLRSLFKYGQKMDQLSEVRLVMGRRKKDEAAEPKENQS